MAKKKKKTRSGFEDTIKGLLESLIGVTFWYEPLRIKYQTEAKYTPDFVIYKGKLKKPKKPLTASELKDTILIETKGYFKPEDRRKMKYVKRSNPDLDIRMVFQRDNYLTKSKKKKYSDWAEQHGFIYAVGTIPKDWYS